MAKKTADSGRVVACLNVPLQVQAASQKAWAAPVLVPPKTSHPLPMDLPRRSQKAPRPVGVALEPGMTLVAGGSFERGESEGSDDEQPQREITLDPFWIDRYPVTNADYYAFVAATGHRPPMHWAGKEIGQEAATHPVTHVSWDDAQAYAAWAGKRLLTEAEWEKAARGTVGQTYPWGDAFRKDNVNSSNDYGGTTAVDRFPGGSSPYGVLDTVGNAQEWCSDWYHHTYYAESPGSNPTGPNRGEFRVVRGGFYGENKAGVRCSARHYAPSSSTHDHIGFRCAKTPVKSEEASPPSPKSTHQVLPPVELPEINADQTLPQMAASRPDLVAKVVRSLLIEDSLSNEQRDELGLPHRQQDAESPNRTVAVLAIGLGSEGASEVLKWLSEAEIRLVADEISKVDIITPSLRDATYEEVRQRLLARDVLLRGGPDFALQAVAKAMGPRKAESLLRQTMTSSGFYLIRNVDPVQIVPYIAKEHPQTIALILTQLDASQAAGILNGLPEELQADVSFRIAEMENISPQVLRELEDALAQDLQAILTGQITEVGGPKATAELLNRTGRSTERSVLERIDARDEGLGEEIRNQMFVFDDIAKLTDREIQRILREVDVKDLAVALKGGSEKLIERIFANISDEVAATLREEMEYSGPVRMSDVEEVQLKIVHAVRDLEMAGEVTIVRGDSTDRFI